MERQNINVPQKIRDQFRKQSQLKKGNIPFNKGVPIDQWMSKDKIENSKATRFKKGDKIYNEKSDFELSLRSVNSGYPYYYIRLKKAKWTLYHRWLWEFAYGKIPSGYNVQFKDGNSLNVTLSNLFLISKKDQSVINKNGGKSLPIDFHNTVLLIQEIKNKLKSKPTLNNQVRLRSALNL